MGIFSRLSDIINSNINALLDRAEDPEKLIRLIIQEMEDTLVEVRSAAARSIADRKEMERRLGRMGDAQAEWQRKAELAISKGRDDLAKGALLEKNKLGETIVAMEEELGRLETALHRNDADVSKLEAKLAEAKAKQKALLARHKTAGQRLKVRKQLNDGRIDDAFERFDVVERRIDRIEGEVESYDLGSGPGGRGPGKSLSDEIDELEAESEIEEELAKLKARLKADDKAAGKKE